MHKQKGFITSTFEFVVSASEIRGINEIMLFEEKTVTVSVVFDARDQSCKIFANCNLRFANKTTFA
jgi:hypothetical protein